MLIRVVRMEFDPNKINDFLEIFHKSEDLIKNAEGCMDVQLKKDPRLSNVFYTHSIWKSEEDLNRYRNSDFFSETWGATKKHFNGKPQAFSLVDP
ncbi:MAG: putative quinol monooxygenase [Cyclobacteriaceae bacterium]